MDCWVTVLLLLLVVVSSSQQVPDAEMTALSSLYNNTAGDTWQWQNEKEAGPEWNFTMDDTGKFVHNPCSSSTAMNYTQTWQGVTCSLSPQLCSYQMCHVTEIILTSYGLAGTIPADIGYLLFLEFLILDENLLTGTIPGEVGQLTSLEICYLHDNELIGTIPGEIWQLISLEQLSLRNNRLIGTISSEVGQLTALKVLHLYTNQLTGTIPGEVGHLSALEQLSLRRNQLTGTIPGEVGKLTALETCYLYSNQLTGTIPGELWQLTTLYGISLYSNHLTGTIPDAVGQLGALELLFLFDNKLTGTLPSDLGKLSSLEILYLDDNHFVGNIPAEMGNIPALEILYMNSNELSGTIPGSIGNLDSIDELWLQDNFLVGALASEMSRMKKLRILFLQNNFLTGHTDKVFNHSTQLELTNIDMSNNRLSRSLSDEMLLLPQLKVLSLSVNCFDEELSQSICLAEEVEVLSLNGLGAAEGCINSVVVPLSGVVLFNTIGGTVPSCVWALRNLSVLHLTGNGLTGELVHSLPVSSQISDLSLSHNQLVGTIPLDILNIANLDLSYNRLGGEYDEHTQHLPDSNVSIEINRLSGLLPVSGLELVSEYGTLSVLRGNLFSCNSIPRNDDYSSDYVCGSLDFNVPLYVFLGGFGITMCLVCWVRFAGVKRPSSLRESMTIMKRVETFSHTVYFQTLRKIALLSGIFMDVMWYAVQLLVMILGSSVVLYIVKATNAYATHSHTYAWFWTVAYMRGVVPAMLLLMLWMVAISACFYRIVVHPMGRHGGRRSEALVEAAHPKPDTAATASSASASRSVKSHVGLIGAAFFFNMCVAITVDAMYIYSTQQALNASIHFWIQLSVSIIKLLYIAMVIPVLARPFKDTVENVRFRFVLLTINSLIIPYLATVFTSDACFQGLFFPEDPVATPYSYRTCVAHSTPIGGETYCYEYSTIDVESSPLSPPFTYNNQCGSVVLTSFIPVFLLGYAIQLIMPIVVVALLTYLPHGSIPPWFLEKLPGIMWPDYWLHFKDETNAGARPISILKIRTILCQGVLNNWLVLMTFGLCSPVLAMAIVCSVLLRMTLWILLIGRFTRCILPPNLASRLASDDDVPSTSNNAILLSRPPETLFRSSVSNTMECGNDDAINFALTALADVEIPLVGLLSRSLWLLVWWSAVFIALLCWDMASDEVGWKQAVWVPLSPLCYAMILSVMSSRFGVRDSTPYLYSAGRDTISKQAPRDECSSVPVSQSPMHDDTDSL